MYNWHMMSYDGDLYLQYQDVEVVVDYRLTKCHPFLNQHKYHNYTSSFWKTLNLKLHETS